MYCSECGLKGHNKNNQTCLKNLIIKSLHNMYDFSKTKLYYLVSLFYITNMYPKILHISFEDINWNGSEKKIVSDFDLAFSNLKYYKYPYVFYNLSIKGSHANSIIINTKNGNFTRYEPHGFYESWGKLDIILSKISAKYKVIYEPPAISCNFFGIQSVSQDMIGLCQTAVLYNLLSKLDKKYNYIKTTSSSEKSKKALLSLLVDLLLNIYIKLPEEVKSLFLNYDNLNVFQKSTVNDSIIATQSQN